MARVLAGSSPATHPIFPHAQEHAERSKNIENCIRYSRTVRASVRTSADDRVTPRAHADARRRIVIVLDPWVNGKPPRCYRGESSETAMSSFESRRIRHAPVAQSGRAPPYEGGHCGGSNPSGRSIRVMPIGEAAALQAVHAGFDSSDLHHVSAFSGVRQKNRSASMRDRPRTFAGIRGRRSLISSRYLGQVQAPHPTFIVGPSCISHRDIRA